MTKKSSPISPETGVAEALPGRVPLALFIGGPLVADAKKGKDPFQELLKPLKSFDDEEETINTLLAYLAKAGFDPLKPSRVGLTFTPGVSLFYTKRAVGYAAAVRSPKKWREALEKEAVKPLRKIKIKNAAEAGVAVLGEGWEIAYARRPPWIYTLIGYTEEKDALDLLKQLVAISPEKSLAAYEPFRKAAGVDTSRSSMALWLGPSLLSDRWSDPPEGDTFRDIEASKESTRLRRIIESFIQVHGMILGVSTGSDQIGMEGLICAEGSLLDALDPTVGQGSQCAIGPRMIGSQCPVWAMSVLDWSLLIRAFPALPNLFKRIAGPLGEMFQLPGAEDRSSGTAAIGICGINPSPPGLDGRNEELDLFAYLDAFLVVELLGQTMPVRMAGWFVDTVGDAVRSRLKRFQGSKEELLTSVTLGGHKFYLTLRRGALIIATSRDALIRARDSIDRYGPETLPSGFLLGAEVDSSRFTGMLTSGQEEEKAEEEDDTVLGELQDLFEQWGKVKLELERVSSGLRLRLQQMNTSNKLVPSKKSSKRKKIKG